MAAGIDPMIIKFGLLEFRIWILFGIWDLELGISSLLPKKQIIAWRDMPNE